MTAGKEVQGDEKSSEEAVDVVIAQGTERDDTDKLLRLSGKQKLGNCRCPQQRLWSKVMKKQEYGKVIIFRHMLSSMVSQERSLTWMA